MFQIGYISSEEKRFDPESLTLSRQDTCVSSLGNMSEKICGSENREYEVCRMQFMFVLDLNTRSSTQVSKIQVMLLPPIWMSLHTTPSGRKTCRTALCEATQLIGVE